MSYRLSIAKTAFALLIPLASLSAQAGQPKAADCGKFGREFTPGFCCTVAYTFENPFRAVNVESELSVTHPDNEPGYDMAEIEDKNVFSLEIMTAKPAPNDPARTATLYLRDIPLGIDSSGTAQATEAGSAFPISTSLGKTVGAHGSVTELGTYQGQPIANIWINCHDVRKVQ